MLHMALHTLVENQIRLPETHFVADAVRLLESRGIDGHEARHVIAEVLFQHLHGTMAGGSPHDPEQYRRDIEAAVRSYVG